MGERACIDREPHGTLPEAIASLAEDSQRVWLIAALDSDRAPALTPVGRRLRDEGVARAVVGDALLVGESTPRELVKDDSVFAGFDEVWALCPPDAHAVVAPPAAITSDRQLLVLPEAVAAWVSEHRPVLGLGDGDGLHRVRP